MQSSPPLHRRRIPATFRVLTVKSSQSAKYVTFVSLQRRWTIAIRAVKLYLRELRASTSKPMPEPSTRSRPQLTSLRATARQATAIAAKATPLNGSLDRIVIHGDVRLDQPGRHGTGEELIYTAGTGTSVLTGTPSKPPVIVDAQHGSITGSSLSFGGAGSTIVVSGSAPGALPRRVHTETQIQQSKEERQ